MTEFHLAVAAFLILNILAGLFRVVAGPRPADRMIAVQILGTTGLAVILLLGAASGEAAAADVAILFALLAALATVAFVRCGAGLTDGDAADRDGEP